MAGMIAAPTGAYALCRSTSESRDDSSVTLDREAARSVKPQLPFDESWLVEIGHGNAKPSKERC
jgi:predicted phage gp36 major capsid-like protein